jgi:hypothetical protein
LSYSITNLADSAHRFIILLLHSFWLQIFYSVCSERMLIEQLQYNLLFRWFVGMEMDEVVWNHAVFSKNRERLLNEEIAETFFRRVLERAKPFMSDEHFTVDGTLIEAWASQKSYRRKDGKGHPPGVGGDVDFHGEKRKNETHASTTDPDARLFRKSKRERGQAELSGTRVDGKSQRVIGADFLDGGQWKSGTRGSDADGGSDPGGPAGDARWRQKL